MTTLCDSSSMHISFSLFSKIFALICFITYLHVNRCKNTFSHIFLVRYRTMNLNWGYRNWLKIFTLISFIFDSINKHFMWIKWVHPLGYVKTEFTLICFILNFNFLSSMCVCLWNSTMADCIGLDWIALNIYFDGWLKNFWLDLFFYFCSIIRLECNH